MQSDEEKEHSRKQKLRLLTCRGSALKALCRAAKAGNLTEIDQWLELDSSLIQGDLSPNKAPLPLALESPNPNAFCHLLLKGANVSIEQYGYKHNLAEKIALHCQWSLAEKVAALEALAKKGVILDPFLFAALKGESIELSEEVLLAKDSMGNNFIHYVSANGHVHLLQQLKATYPLLVINPANDNSTPLLLAARNGQLATVQWLLRESTAQVAEQDAHGGTPLLWAAQNGHLAVVQWLLCEGGANITERDLLGNTALLCAAGQGRLEVVRWLLDKGGAQITEKSAGGTTALLWATRGGHLGVVQWLLREGGARVTERTLPSNTALLLAAKEGRLELVRWLLRGGGAKITEKNDNGFTALLMAAQEGQLDVVQWLLCEGGAKVIERTNLGTTALLLAAREGQLGVVQWLLREGGAKVTERTNLGSTALLLAAHEGQLKVVQWLLCEGGAKITEQVDGWTALLSAAHQGQLEVVQWLLREGGAKATERTKLGVTALLLAAQEGRLEVVKWLLGEGNATITEQNKDGWNALRLAAYCHHAHTVSWLVADYGADPTDGREIAKLLGVVGYRLVEAKANELRELSYQYYKRRQNEINNRLLEAGLPARFPKVLRNIITEYAAPNAQEEPYLLQQMSAQNEGLLEELKAHAESRTLCFRKNFFLPWQDLSRDLMAKITSHRPCDVLTTHLAVNEFLSVQAKKIAGSKLFAILQNILQQTCSLELPGAATLSKEELAEKEQATSDLQSGKPNNLINEGLSLPVCSEAAATEISLVCQLKDMEDPQVRTLEWHEGKNGTALAYFNNEGEAKNIMALLKGKHPELTFHLGSVSSSSFPTAQYYLSAAFNNVTLVLASATDNVALVPASSSRLFAVKRSSSSQDVAKETLKSVKTTSVHPLATSGPSQSSGYTQKP